MGLNATNSVCLVTTAERKALLEAAGLTTRFISLKSTPPSDEQKAMRQFLEEQDKISSNVNLQGGSELPANASENLWGEIVNGGNIIAKIYKNGCVETEHNNLIVNPTSSASERAEEIIRQFGGKLVLTISPAAHYTSQHMVPTCDWLGVVS